MKKIKSGLLGIAVCAVLLTACGGAKGGTVAGALKAGKLVDKVIWTVTMDQSIGLKDVVEGKVDLMSPAVPPSILETLSDADRDKLEFYTVPSGAWSLITNPIPNKAPYTFTTTAGELVFNPLAITEVRYALNWLIDRKKIVDEILKGEGEPSFTAMTPGQPGVYRYNLLPAKLGMTATGDETKALETIENAMQAATKLPENAGRLVKKDGFWQFNGKNVFIKFYIRADDPTGRLPSGNYIAAQIEKAGIKVERLLWDRSKSSLVYSGDPKDFEWSMYTEGWGAGATRRWWDVSVSQMYAPYYGYMPGGAEEGNWNYKNDRIDDLAQKGYYGRYMEEKDYWAGNLEALELGLKDAVRIYICVQHDNFVANKARFNSRMLYGMGEGINKWSVRYADVKPEPKGSADEGKRVLRLVQHSARGSLFMSAWDPIGTGGFADVYASLIVSPLSDLAKDEAPNDAIDIALASTVDMKNYEISPKLDEKGNLTGNVAVPANAVKYDSAAKTWKEVGPGLTAAAKGTGSLKAGYTWHHGEAMDVNDARYAGAFLVDWCTKDGDSDPYFDAPLSAVQTPNIENAAGTVFNSDGSVTSYQNYYFVADQNRTIIENAALSTKPANPGRQTLVPWEIYEALSEMVATGSASGTVYNVTQGGGGATEVDVLAVKCVADIKAKLESFVATKHIPVYLKGFISEEAALKRYNAAIAFISKYGHAYISNGPLFLTQVDPTTNSAVAENFAKYPYAPDYWPKQFAQTISSINFVRTPSAPTQDKDAVFEVSVSSFIYPNIDHIPLKDGKVTINLQHEDGTESVYAAKKTGDGKFEGTIPAADLAKLKKGVEYTVVVISSIANESPSVITTRLLLL